MFKLFRKELKPKVYAFVFRTKKGAEKLVVSDGYSFDEAYDNIDESKEGIEGRPLFWVDIDIEEYANKYSQEKMSMNIIKK